MGIPATPEEQRNLHALQEVDTTILRLEHRRAHLPEQQALDSNAETLSSIASDYAEAREQLDRLRLQQKRHETEIATVDSRRKAEEGRKYSGLITSTREVEALDEELRELKRRKLDLEDALLEIMEQVEELEAKVGKLETQHKELTAKVAELTAARDTAATDIDAEIAALGGQRAEAAAKIPAELLETYDDLRGRKQGLAVAVLERRTCGGCRLELTAIELEEVREQAATSLGRCTQCGRILVIL